MRKNLSIATVTASLSREAGGMFYSVRSPLVELQRAGDRIEVFGVADSSSSKDASAWGSIPTKAFPRWGPEKLAYSPRLRSELFKSDPDILHLHGLWQYPSLAVLRWNEHFRRPVVISPHGMLDEWAVSRSPLKKKLALTLFERRNLRSATCLRALNESEARSIRVFGLTNPIAIIPNGTDIPRQLDIQSAPKPEWAQDGRLPLLFLGRIHPKKGISETLRAWAHLRQTAPSIFDRWRLVIAGWDDGGYLSRLRNEAASLGLGDDCVSFPGPVFNNDKVSALTHSRAFILASYSEGLPMSILEAWAYGLPVFMSDACNLQCGFEHQAAVQVSLDPYKLAATLGSHLARDDLAEIGARGRRLVTQRFTWPQIACMLEQLHLWLLSESELDAPSFLQTCRQTS